jgi:hypothetical protein
MFSIAIPGISFKRKKGCEYMIPPIMIPANRHKNKIKLKCREIRSATENSINIYKHAFLIDILLDAIAP